MTKKLAVMILACSHHAGSIARMLDETGVKNWIIMPGAQARLMGFLQNVPRHHDGSTAIFGFAERKVVGQALQVIGRAEREHGICPNCIAYVWEATETAMANVALDPVCEEVVDRQTALDTTYQGTQYYFCSDSCLQSFRDDPATYVERSQMEQRVGRRDLVSTAPKPSPLEKQRILEKPHHK